MTNWIPEIMYEDDVGGLSSHIPFIHVPYDNEMPKMIFIFESRDSGEVEPGPDGEDLPVVELDLHQYADMSILKDGLDSKTYDLVRSVLGLEPLGSAVKKGQDITQAVRDKIDSH